MKNLLKEKLSKGENAVGTFVEMGHPDVTNILRLIGEVSNLNLIWSPDVKGKVSMRLKQVPWDQALDLVLANNKLGMRREGNVIWVTTKAQITQIEEEERQKRQRAEAELKKKLEEEKRSRTWNLSRRHICLLTSRQPTKSSNTSC